MRWWFVGLSGCFVISGDDLRAHDEALAGQDTDVPTEPDPDPADPAVDGDTGRLDGGGDPGTAIPLGVPITGETCQMVGPLAAGVATWFVATGLAAGEVVEVWLEPDPGGTRLEVRLAADEPGVALEAASAAAPSGGPELWLGLTFDAALDEGAALCVARVDPTEVEPNDDPSDPGSQTSWLELPVGGRSSSVRAIGALATGSDVDRYRFEPRAGVTYAVGLDPTSAVEAVTLAVTDLGGAELARTAPGDSALVWVSSDVEPVALVVSGAPTATGQAGAYTVWLDLYVE